MRYFLIAILLSGCSASEIAVRQTERSIDVYGPACDRLGYQPQSDGWRDCIVKLSTRR